MLWDPTNRNPYPLPETANDFRMCFPLHAWLWNPWTGKRRTTSEVGMDSQGRFIQDFIPHFKQ